MYQKYVRSITILLVGLFSILVGIFMIIRNVALYEVFIKLLSVALFIIGLSSIGKAFFEKNKKVSFLKGFMNIILSFIMLLFPTIPSSILPILCALYLLVNSLIDFIYYIVLYNNRVKGKSFELAKAVFFLLLSIPLLFSPLMNLKYVLVILGIYLIGFGASSVATFISELIPSKSRQKIKKRIHISLPIFITTFIPYSVLNDINHYLGEDSTRKNLPKKENREDYDIEVLVHVSKEDSTGTIGHVDLWYNGQIISYGNYDMKSRKLWDTLGDGVVFTCDKKEDYIHFCQKHSKKILFGFGLKLTDRQKESIKKEMEKLKSETYEWVPYYKLAVKEKKKIKKDDFMDYASVLYKMTHASFYKFYGTKFKTFFIFTTNCVALADRILGAAGAGILRITGFVSPGSYYDYLYREFCKKNSAVVSYQVYTESGNFYE